MCCFDDLISTVVFRRQNNPRQIQILLSRVDLVFVELSKPPLNANTQFIYSYKTDHFGLHSIFTAYQLTIYWIHYGK